MSEDNNGHLPKPKKKNRSAAELAHELRDREKSRRPARWLALLVMAALLTAPVALAVWWFWPMPDPPEVMIVAFDSVTRPGGEMHLVACLQPRQTTGTPIKLDSWPVIFARKLIPGEPADPIWKQSATTNATGTAIAKIAGPDAAGMQTFRAVYAPEHAHLNRDDQARVYCWPKTSKLLLVDVETSLADAKLDAWTTAEVRGIHRRDDVAATLDNIVVLKQYKIVYLACQVPSPREYHKTRIWLRLPPMDQAPPFREGPVLGKISYNNNGDAETALQQRIGQLTEKFSTKIFGLTSDKNTATVFQRAGVHAILVGKNAKAPNEIVVVESWAAAAKQLP